MDATRHPLGPPVEPARPTHADRRDAATRHRMALYQQPGILVTTEWFIAAGRQFPVDELTHLRTARGPHHPMVVRAVLVTGAVLAAIGAALSFTHNANDLSAGTYLALGAAAFVPVLLASVGQRMRPRAFELWAQYRGQAVLVFSSDHEREYGQVTRALIRAREMARLGGVAGPVAETNPWQPPPR